MRHHVRMKRLARCAGLGLLIAGARLLGGAETAVQDGRIAGGAHLVVRDGRTLYSEAAGFGDIQEQTPFTADSILRIYSMSKPITSVAAMRLFEQGKFGLDDPVARFIPAFTNATVLETVDGKPRQVPPKRPITVRDVLRHTTGYSYGDEASVREFYEREGLRYWGPHQLFPPKMTIARAAEALARVPALHHPGEKFTYGFSTDLLGRLIEIWSGEPLDRYLQRAVFEPLEMTDTGFAVPREKRARFTSCHTLAEGKLAVVDPAASSPFNDGFEFLSGGGGLVSTVRDYANFCQMLVDGGQFKGRRLLQPETLRLMFTDQLDGVDGANRFGLGFAMTTSCSARVPIPRNWPNSSSRSSMPDWPRARHPVRRARTRARPIGRSFGDRAPPASARTPACRTDGRPPRTWRGKPICRGGVGRRPSSGASASS
jgi:CubicO group peptidase (beta-lactamase class C family)